jgi:hypothetical protein
LATKIRGVLMEYNRHNFHRYTFCAFKEVSFLEIENTKPNYKSKSGSTYYFNNEGVFRVSNHWGRAANCRWRLLSSVKIKSQIQKCGFAKWTDFYPNNETEKLFYVEVNWDTLETTFQHKNNSCYKEVFVLRNANDTAKRIQIIKEILTTLNWSKHLEFENIENLRKEIVFQLIETNDTFIKIKQNYVG